jgi:hypothetical protein
MTKKKEEIELLDKTLSLADEQLHTLISGCSKEAHEMDAKTLAALETCLQKARRLSAITGKLIARLRRTRAS